MNNYTEFNSKSFLIILFLICAVFLVLIIKAFSYIPDSDSNQIVSRNANINTNTQQEQPVTEQVETDTNTNVDTKETITQKNNEAVVKEEKKSLNVPFLKPGSQENLENIEDLPKEAEAANSSDSNSEQAPAEPTIEEKVMKIFLDADKLKKDKQYVKAIEEYQKISTMTNDTNTIAKSYEEIATIYAIVKRYGTALSYAQKAYNMSPSSSREMLLARLYYKTGDMDKATRRINNILQRDFSADK